MRQVLGHEQLLALTGSRSQACNACELPLGEIWEFDQAWLTGEAATLCESRGSLSVQEACYHQQVPIAGSRQCAAARLLAGVWGVSSFLPLLGPGHRRATPASCRGEIWEFDQACLTGEAATLCESRGSLCVQEACYHQQVPIAGSRQCAAARLLAGVWGVSSFLPLLGPGHRRATPASCRGEIWEFDQACLTGEAATLCESRGSLSVQEA